MKLSIVIPAFNESATIERVLDRLSDSVGNFHEIIVIDDASTDETQALVEKRASLDPRIRILRHPQNAGKTAALRTGFAAVTGDLVVVQDADLEYDPADIPDLIAPILDNRGDVSLGSRFMVKRAGRVPKTKPLLRRDLHLFLAGRLRLRAEPAMLIEPTRVMQCVFEAERVVDGAREFERLAVKLQRLVRKTEVPQCQG